MPPQTKRLSQKARRAASKTKEAISKRPLPPGKRKEAEFEYFALFTALPHSDRKAVFGFDTDAQFGKEYKVNPGTLSEWKWDPKFYELRDKYLIHFKKHTADVLNALASRAKRTGDAFHVLTYMKIVEDFSEKSGLDLTTKGQKVSGFRIIINEPGGADNKKS